MSRIFAIHEYELTHDTDSQEFEQVLKDILLSKELDMPGLESRHFLKGYKVQRKNKYSVLWVFESQETLKKLLGKDEAQSVINSIFDEIIKEVEFSLNGNSSNE